MAPIRDFLPVLMDPYFIVDEQRALKDHNRSFLELSGGRKKPSAHCHEMVKLEICKNDCIALRALRAGRAVQVSEIHGQSLDGRELVLMGSAIPIKNDDGTVTSILVTYRDVTEETRAREGLQKLERESRIEKEVLLKNLTEQTQQVEAFRKQIETLRRRGPGTSG